MIASKQEHINFLNKNLLEQVQLAIDNGQNLTSFILMAQAIEIMGSYFDQKPIRAKNQSKKRFAIAINKLFPRQYGQINSKNFLYVQLRTCLIHMFVPTTKLQLLSGFETDKIPHLSVHDDALVLYNQNFFADYKTAIQELIKRIENNSIKLKRIADGDYDY